MTTKWQVCTVLAAAYALAASPAAALDDNLQILSGGGSIVAGSSLFTAPGLSNQYGINFPGAGLGEQAASIRMQAGTASNLRVNVVTENVPKSGTLTVTVRKNGNATNLQCSVSGTGTCNSNKSVNFGNNARLVINASNNFVESGFVAYTYTLVYD